MSEIRLRKAQSSDMEEIALYIDKYKLDGENLHSEQFIIAEIDGNLAGFGRIKPYERMKELSSIGIIENYRQSGVGRKLINYLIELFPDNEIWITTKVPEFFEKFGFQESDTPPEEVKHKCHRICSSMQESPDESCYMVLKK